jgi:hypothetical protein
MYSLDNNFQYRRDDDTAQEDEKEVEEEKDKKETKENDTFAML